MAYYEWYLCMAEIFYIQYKVLPYGSNTLHTTLKALMFGSNILHPIKGTCVWQNTLYPIQGWQYGSKNLHPLKLV